MERITSFKPRFAMTVHKSQGSTFTENYSIYEYEDMTSRMLYVALTRARDKQQINFCKIDDYKPHTGYIYIYIVMNILVDVTLVQPIIYLNENKNTRKEQKQVTLNLKKQ